MKRETNNICLKVLVGFALIIITFLFSVCFSTVYAIADNTTYSTVLDDLRRDPQFSISRYKVDKDDNSLQVIQIAETTDGALLLYVYQPSGQSKNLRATSVNICTDKISATQFSSAVESDSPEFHFENYKLAYLNSEGVFFKYLVKDFKVKTDLERYYSITSIYRPFDEKLDIQADNDNKITEVNYAVSKQFLVSGEKGQVSYEGIEIETITVTDKFVGFVRYKNGFELHPSSCDSHFVAFNTDKTIDTLLEADVYYTSQSYSWSMISFVGENETFGEKSDEYAYLKYTDKVVHTGDGWFAGTYKWDRIETVEQFVAENDLTQNVYSGAIIDVNVANRISDEGKAALKGNKWVLRFAETTYTLSGSTGSTFADSTLVGDVTILRLKFETDGITYNLGTIDNKQTGSDKPINNETYDVVVNNRGKWILGIIAAILLLIILAPVLPYVIQFIVWLVLLPFKVIGAVFKGIGKAANKRKRGK